MTTAAEIEALFRAFGVNPAWEARGGESAQERYQRIADEVNRGERDLDHVRASLRSLKARAETDPDNYPSAEPEEEEDDEPDPEDFISRIKAIFPDMPDDFIRALSEAWAENADYGIDVALATLRADTRYERWFPGNLADDGTVHLSEGDYWRTRRQYADVLTQIGVDSRVFSDDQYVDLIRGDVDVSEWGARIRSLSNEILATAEDYGLRGYYAELYGIASVSDAAILESAFAGNSDAIRRQIGQALVGYEGELRGFDIQLQLASSLFDANIRTQGQAAELFGDAASKVPLFGRLAERHFDPDDDYDLGEYLEAAVFDDQEQLSRMNRLLATERAQFSAYRPLRQRGDANVGLLAK